MDYTTEDLKNMQELQDIRFSMPLLFYPDVSEIELFSTVSSPDVFPGSMVNIK